ncbi:hypothetical protein P3802_19580 [Pseudomonas aeruginosa]|nr:hypothetical protein [Pseudomonas aeruginosa]
MGIRVEGDGNRVAARDFIENQIRFTDDDLSTLAKRLAHAMEGLPLDGNHELRLKVKGLRNGSGLAQQSIRIEAVRALPPVGTGKERYCPQCEKPTWRYTELCMHCDYNLYAHDELEQQVAAKERIARYNSIMRRVFFFSAGLALALGLLAYYLPTSQTVKLALGVTGGFISFLALLSIREIK